MARRTNMEELIHCDACGEDYSATYKRCPFCGEKYDTHAVNQSADDDDDDGYVFDGQDLFDDDPEDTQASSAKGGKRLTGTATGTRRAAPQSRSAAAINWPRLITFICSLIIIVAALVIIFTVIFPQIHSDPNPSPSASMPAVSNEPAVSDPPADPSSGFNPAASQAPVIDPGLNGFTMKGKNDLDFTLRVGETHTLVPVFDPEDWEGEVTFTSSDTNYATVDENGTVTNVNSTTSLRRVTITVSAGGHTVECTVYCRGTASGSDAPDVVVTPTPDPNASESPSTGGLTIGAKGTIVGAASGLRVRSGPGTTYDILASLVNGNTVTILADAGGGWYQISFSGSNGATTTGYIMGQYISVP